MKKIVCLLIAFLLVFALIPFTAVTVLAKDDGDEDIGKDDEKDDLAMDRPDDSLSKNPDKPDYDEKDPGSGEPGDTDKEDNAGTSTEDIPGRDSTEDHSYSESRNVNTGPDPGSILSDGNLWIIGIGAVVCVGGIAFAISKRKTDQR